MVGAELGEGFRADVIADCLVVEVAPPVDVNGSWEVTGIVEKDILIAFDDADGWVVEVVGEPAGADEDIRVGVGREFIAHDLVGIRWSRADGEREIKRGVAGSGGGGLGWGAVELIEAQFWLVGADFAWGAGPDEGGFRVEGGVEASACFEFRCAAFLGALIAAQIAFEFVAGDGEVGEAPGSECGGGGSGIREVGNGFDGEGDGGFQMIAIGEAAGGIGQADFAALDKAAAGWQGGGGPCEEFASRVGLEAVEVGP